ncbi:MAG: hypothetical protein JXA78_11490 [Anaerolineales bacterium]|nr:hypothetical protein [Anaerolineales bacterium]
MSKKILIPIVVTLVVALLAGAWVSGEALAQSLGEDGGGRLKRLAQIRQRLGQVTAIDADSFTVQRLDGESFTVLVDDETRFIDKERNELAFADLATGRWVIVAAPENDAGERLARLVVLLPEDFDPSQFAGAIGKITGVDLDAQQFMLQDRQGEQKTFDVDQQTQFKGEAESLADLSEGMLAGVRAQQQADGSMLAQTVAARLQLQRCAGEIVSVNEASSTFTLKTRRGDQELTFAVDEHTRFRTKDGELDDLADLEPGMVAIVMAQAGAQGETPIARLVGAIDKDQLPEFDKRIGGRVTSVDQNSFTIRARDGQEYTFQVTGSTKFRSQGNQVQGLEDLQEGMAVGVGAKELGNGNYQAQLVIVVNRQR